MKVEKEVTCPKCKGRGCTRCAGIGKYIQVSFTNGRSNDVKGTERKTG